MEKNVIVLDEFDEQVGFTYAKRAKGLVKNGRAEYVGGCDGSDVIKIRLTAAHAPSECTEDNDMSNVINFNAREFKFDETCETRAGQRVIVRDPFGENVESFEIGDKEWTWTQIKRDVKLEKNTDYIFRFAVMGGACKGYGKVARFVLVPRVSASGLDDEAIAESDWEERYNYSLDKIAPAVKVNTPNGLFSVFEIAFNSGDCELFTLMFIAKQTGMNIMPACEPEKYSDIAANANSDVNCDAMAEMGSIDLSNARISTPILEKAIEMAGRGVSVDLSNVEITSVWK